MNRYKQLLIDKKINPSSTIEYDINGEIHTISLEWIIDAYLQTEKKEYFEELCEKVMQGRNENIETFFQKMGQLVLMSSLSINEFEEI